MVDPIISRGMAKSLSKANVKYKHDEFEGIGHGVGLSKGTVAEPWFENTFSFWMEQE